MQIIRIVFRISKKSLDCPQSLDYPDNVWIVWKVCRLSRQSAEDKRILAEGYLKDSVMCHCNALVESILLGVIPLIRLVTGCNNLKSSRCKYTSFICGSIFCFASGIFISSFKISTIKEYFSRTSTIKFNTVGNKSKTHNSGKSYFYDTGNYNDHDCDSLIYDWPWPWRRPWLLILRYQRKFALLQGFLLRNMLTIASNGYGKDFDAHDNDFVVLILSSIVTTMN